MKPQRPLHPLLARADEIAERGLMVFDDICSMPIYHEPFTTNLMTIGVNLCGWVKAECDMRPLLFQAHDLAVLTPHHILCAHESSADYHAMLIVLSPAFQEMMKRRYPHVYRDNHHYLYRQDIHLNERQFQRVVDCFRLLRDVSREDSPRRDEMLGNLLEVLFLLLQDYRHENGIENHRPTPREELFTNFHNAIEQHYRESREVCYYADLFHLSPKHFATVIKQQTGTGALQWINSYVIIQAKSLLRHHRQMTIQQITTQLGFPDQAAFSRYFKNNTGLSPTQYRERN
ncbi:MAG: AraC family transcriptional regulator [Prevotella sp.]|nr:AraC family transcriptional regulator [Prevotella sp.]